LEMVMELGFIRMVYATGVSKIGIFFFVESFL
jgi:hypothetical protein